MALWLTVLYLSSSFFFQKKSKSLAHYSNKPHSKLKLIKIQIKLQSQIISHCPNLSGTFLTRSDLLIGSWNVTRFFDPGGRPLGRLISGDIGSVLGSGVISVDGAGVAV